MHGFPNGFMLVCSFSMTQTPHAHHSLDALRLRHGERYRWLLLLSVMVGTMASVMSSTIVNVAIPGLSAHFSLGQAQAQWVTSGFMGAMTMSMLTTPWLLGRFGYRATYVGCMLLLLAGGLVGGLTDSFGWVLAARVAEGLAAGVVQPIPAIIILRAFEPGEQGRASGLFGMGVVLAPAIGPSIGGVLVDVFGWRSIFFMVVPFCVVSVWLARRYVPSTAPGGSVAGPAHGALDWPGLVLVSVATVALLNGLVAWHRTSASAGAGLLALSLGCMVAFVAWQLHLKRRKHQTVLQPLMGMHLFASQRFAMGSVVGVIYGTAMFGSTYLLPVYLQMGLELSASYVGGLLLPSGLVLAVTIVLGGKLADRLSPHLLVTLGLALLAASFVLMLTLDLPATGSTLTLLLAWSMLGRMGLGLVLASLNLGAMRGLHRQDIPQGASVINFVRMLGGAAGVSLCGIVLDWRLAVHGTSLADHALQSGANRLVAFEETFLMLAALCALAMVAAWRMRSPEPGADVHKV